MSDSLTSCPKAFVLGHPIRHSKSPALHQAAYRVLGEQIVYECLDTVEDQLASVFECFGPHSSTCGFSVTMPLKSAVIAYLDELTPFARAVGVVNTVYWREIEGLWRSFGHNTDVSGIVNALRQEGLLGLPARAAVLGGGGTATAALAALRFMGSTGVDVFVRDPRRAEGAQQAAQRLGMDLTFIPLAEFWSRLEEYELTISTLPAGAADKVVETGPRAHRAGYLLDVSYDPWPSKLALAYQESGGRVTSGLEMLMYQAVDQVRLFTGRSLEDYLPYEQQVLEAMRKAVDLPLTGYLPQQVSDPSALGM
ncbi:shikimate dehydrogenase [Rothia sp. P5766]|uniref:shikimate dehydrogenase n=1 Tax=Rothia sp. P5766 TaxID=3402656 RepID=UPI003ADACE31